MSRFYSRRSITFWAVSFKFFPPCEPSVNECDAENGSELFETEYSAALLLRNQHYSSQCSIEKVRRRRDKEISVIAEATIGEVPHSALPGSHSHR